VRECSITADVRECSITALLASGSYQVASAAFVPAPPRGTRRFRRHCPAGRRSADKRRLRGPLPLPRQMPRGPRSSARQLQDLSWGRRSSRLRRPARPPVHSPRLHSPAAVALRDTPCRRPIAGTGGNGWHCGYGPTFCLNHWRRPARGLAVSSTR
jgi:hypothetical protein